LKEKEQNSTGIFNHWHAKTRTTPAAVAEIKTQRNSPKLAYLLLPIGNIASLAFLKSKGQITTLFVVFFSFMATALYTWPKTEFFEILERALSEILRLSSSV
jgi:hypothetical protein